MTRSLLIVFIVMSAITAQAQQAMQSTSRVHVFRLGPHQDLKKSLVAWAQLHKIKAAVVVTCVGSLEQYTLRFANQENGTSLAGHFEIVSLTGTISETSTHLHLAVSDSTGQTTGGHLLDGNFIYTTTEIAIAELPDLAFGRETDTTYGYKELTVKRRSSKP
ncbi:MAG TPA: PPC domain-containing DNA-binding protein [Ohtaekwangia sp.]|uniref:PPC domain-containing DNA-binding protein n=1 Tax=Ohtaekwangia sp. TaxID=2066019 RepID=UPI002F926C7E